jgi:hypothetical protein
MFLRVAFTVLLCVSAALSQSSSSGASAQDSHHRFPSLSPPTNLVIDGPDTLVAPLSSGQKFNQFGKNFFNPFTFLTTGVQAGLEQASDSPSGYGQGAQGYGKRYGADIADTFTGQLFGIGVYPSLLHTDPRYYRKVNGNIFSRGTYAATRVFVTRKDASRRRVFNWSELLGSATSAGISMTYYPSDERDAGTFATSFGTRILFDGAFNVAKEFWPDVRDHLFRHKDGK